MTSLGLAHDYLTQKGGAERVFLAMHDLFPSAPLSTMIFNRERTFPEFATVDIEVSFLSMVALFREDPQKALPLLPAAVRSMHVDADVALCSSSGWAHGIRSSGRKIVYCHNPPRWLYQREDYLKGRGLVPRMAATMFGRPLKVWDMGAALAADLYIANSTSVRDRIRSSYGIEAEIVFPPVTLVADGLQEELEVDEGFYLTVSRSRGYKNVETVCEAFRARPDRRLVVVGRRPDSVDSARKNISFLSDLSDAAVRWLYANCVALVAVSREDFGLTPLEANLFGKPVVAPAAWGYLDTVVFGRTGVKVRDVTSRSLNDAIDCLEGMSLSPDEIREHAQKFSLEKFHSGLARSIDRVV